MQVVYIELCPGSCILRVVAVNKLTLGLPLQEPTKERERYITVHLELSYVLAWIIQSLCYILQKTVVWISRHPVDDIEFNDSNSISQGRECYYQDRNVKLYRFLRVALL